MKQVLTKKCCQIFLLWKPQFPKTEKNVPQKCPFSSKEIKSLLPCFHIFVLHTYFWSTLLCWITNSYVPNVPKSTFVIFEVCILHILTKKIYPIYNIFIYNIYYQLRRADCSKEMRADISIKSFSRKPRKSSEEKSMKILCRKLPGILCTKLNENPLQKTQ